MPPTPPRHTVATSAPEIGAPGDEWFNPSTNRLYKMLSYSGGAPTWVEMTMAASLASGTLASSALSVTGTTALRRTVVDNPARTSTIIQPIRKSTDATNQPVGQNVPSMTLAFTVEAGDNRILIIILHSPDNKTYNTITWTVGGTVQNCTMVVKPVSTRGHSLWYLKDPTVGSGNLFTTVSDGSNTYAGLSCTQFNNVDPVNPIQDLFYKPGLKPTGSSTYGTISDSYGCDVGKLMYCTYSYFNNGFLGFGALDSVYDANEQLEVYNKTVDGGHRHMGWIQTQRTGSDLVRTNYVPSPDGTYYPIYMTINAPQPPTAPRSTLDINGSIGNGITYIDKATTIDDTHNVIVCGGWQSYAITLPSARVVGRTYTIKKILSGSYTLTITPQTGQTIDGQLSLSIVSQYASVTIVAFNGEWLIV